MSKRIEATPHDHLQAESRSRWEINPMTYDWHKIILAPEGTREFYDEIDRRFFTSSFFYRGKRPFERWIPSTAFEESVCWRSVSVAGYFLFAIARRDAPDR